MKKVLVLSVLSVLFLANLAMATAEGVGFYQGAGIITYITPAGETRFESATMKLEFEQAFEDSGLQVIFFSGKLGLSCQTFPNQELPVTGSLDSLSGNIHLTTKGFKVGRTDIPGTICSGLFNAVENKMRLALTILGLGATGNFVLEFTPYP